VSDTPPSSNERFSSFPRSQRATIVQKVVIMPILVATDREAWEQTSRLDTLTSSSEWSFPPRPDTHHVRWIACHPLEAGRLWVAIEAGALVSTIDGGRAWRDRVAGGPWDTHELAVHRNAADTLRVSAGDGYFESDDAGATWRSPSTGFEVGYLRSVTIDPGEPDGVVVSASSGPYTAYVAGRSDGRLYRRVTPERWERVRAGWPEPPSTIAPLLCAGAKPGEMWALAPDARARADEKLVQLLELLAESTCTP
jgi:hypothetical protein